MFCPLLVYGHLISFRKKETCWSCPNPLRVQIGLDASYNKKYGCCVISLESSICSTPKTTLVPGIFASGTNEDINTGWGGRARRDISTGWGFAPY
jgi:hypothetical protein